MNESYGQRLVCLFKHMELDIVCDVDGRTLVSEESHGFQVSGRSAVILLLIVSCKWDGI